MDDRAPHQPIEGVAAVAAPALPVKGEGATGGLAMLMSASAGMVGVLSYTCTLVMAHLLGPVEFTAFAAAVALVGTAGIASTALIPFPLAHVVRAHPSGSPQRRDAMTFAAGVSLLVGLVAAVLLGTLTLGFAPLTTAVAAAVSSLALFAIAPVWGFLQGESRFVRYAVLTVGEVAVRLVVSVAAVALGAGAGGAVGGFAVGAIAVIAAATAGPLRDIDPSALLRVLADRTRWAETGGVAAAQAVLSVLTVVDVVVVALLVTAPADAAAAGGYQAVATLAKAPVYVAVGTALVSFPVLRVATAGRERDARLREALVSFVRLVVPAAAVIATVPPAVVGLVLPAEYAPSLVLLGWLAVAGAGLGTTTVLATLLLAVRARLALVSALSGALATLGTGIVVGLAAESARVDGLARGVAVGAVAGALVVGVVGWRHRPRSARASATSSVRSAGLGRTALRGAVYAGLVVTVLATARSSTPLWIAAVVLIGVGIVGFPVLMARVRDALALASGRPVSAPGGLRILHLGFEDPAMPGSGGGALRTGEIDRRLAAAGHRVTVVCQRYPGATDRIERCGAGSVSWVHPGFGRGRTRLTRLLSYVVASVAAARRTDADLVVEDFFAPVSSIAVPRWTRVPVVGVVQWLNAREKARQYHLPVHWVERWAVRTHRRLVAVSHGVAGQLAALSPAARIAVIGNGVDPVAFRTHRRAIGAGEGTDVVFVGRLEIAQKGLDLLLDAWALAIDRVPGRLVLAGTGPDEQALRDRAERLGIAHRVRFAGWVAGADKFRLVGSARLAVVPSRFETFGIVAAEALAAGTAVVAYDIACLREVVPAESGVLVPLTGDHERDATAYAEALVTTWHGDARRRVAAEHGPDMARIHDWDALARVQDDFYREVVHTGRSTGETRR